MAGTLLSWIFSSGESLGFLINGGVSYLCFFSQSSSCFRSLLALPLSTSTPSKERGRTHRTVTHALRSWLWWGGLGGQSALPASAYTKQTKCVTIRPGSVVTVKGVMSTFFPSHFLAPRSLSTRLSPLRHVTFSAFWSRGRCPGHTGHTFPIKFLLSRSVHPRPPIAQKNVTKWLLNVCFCTHRIHPHQIFVCCPYFGL